MPYNPSSITELDRVMQEIQELIEHPRIKQRTWVAKGKTWLPILQIIHGELTRRHSSQDDPNQITIDNTPPSPMILVQVQTRSSKAFINIPLTDIKEVQVDERPIYMRGVENSFTLKSGKKHFTTYEESKKIIDALHKYNESLES